MHSSADSVQKLTVLVKPVLPPPDTSVSRSRLVLLGIQALRIKQFRQTKHTLTKDITHYTYGHLESILTVYLLGNKFVGKFVPEDLDNLFRQKTAVLNTVQIINILCISQRLYANGHQIYA